MHMMICSYFSAATPTKLLDFSSNESDCFLKLFFFNLIEYAIAFLGSVEGGLIATTINPSYTSEEISRQMLSCRPKAVICLAENIDVIRMACVLAQQPDIKLIIIQNDPNCSRPSGTISFNEVMSTDGNNNINEKIFLSPILIRVCLFISFRFNSI